MVVSMSEKEFSRLSVLMDVDGGRPRSSKSPSLFIKLYNRPERAKPSCPSVLVDAAPSAADKGGFHDR